MPAAVTRLGASVLMALALRAVAHPGSADAARCLEWETRPVTLPNQSTVIATVCKGWATEPGERTPAGEGVAPGGGSGGESNCTSEPYGPISEVRKIWNAINRGKSPDIDDPSAPDRSYFFGPWYRISPAKIELRYLVTCVNPAKSYDVWVTVSPSETGFAPQVTPGDLIPDAFDQVRRMLPTPVPRIAPSDLAPDGFAFVQTPTFFWVDQAPGQWESVSATAAVAGLSLTVTAAPEELVVSTGDGTTLQCRGAPPAFPAGADPSSFDGCAHVYRHSSAMADNGATYPVTVAIVWHATWQASTGASGDLGTLTTTSATRDLPVAEIQAVVTQG